MTVANNYHKVTYVGNGSTTSFSFDFPIIGDSSIKVYVSIDDTETEVDASNYSVNVSDNGGNVVFKTAPVKGSVVAIIRLTDQTQETPYKTSSGFPAVRVEEAFDKLTMITQEQQEVLDRCLKVVPTNGQKPQELLDEVYARLDSSIEIAESAQKAANEASSAVVRAEDLLEDTTEYVTTSKAEIGTLKTETINEVEGVSASAIASVTSTSLAAVDSINTAKTTAETNIAKIVSNAEGTIEEIAVEAAQKEVANAASQAETIATNNLNAYVNNTVKPSLTTYTNEAKSYRDSALTYSNNAKTAETNAKVSEQNANSYKTSASSYSSTARTWATGEDADVDVLEQGEHSARGYADLSMAIANTPEDVPVDASTLLALEVIKVGGEVPTKLSQLENDKDFLTYNEIAELMQAVGQQLEMNTTNIANIQNQIGDIETALAEV